MTAGSAEPGRAWLRLIGEFRLVSPEGRPVEIASRRARALVGYLALAPQQSATRGRLRGLLWSDRGEAQARASLRQCLLAVRAALGAAGLDLMAVNPERVELAAGGLTSDVDDLRGALSAGDVDAVLACLEPMGEGQLLEGLEIGGLFRDWLDQTRARLDQTIAVGVSGLISSLESRERWWDARAVAHAYLARDPADERVRAAARRAESALGSPGAGVGEGVGRGAFADRPRVTVAEPAASPPIGTSPKPVARGLLNSQGPPLVAVAAFGTVHEPGEDRQFATVLRDEITSGLSRFAEFKVVADGRDLEVVAGDPPDGGLGAYALGASLSLATDGRRVIVRLLRGGERRVVWSRRFLLPTHGDPAGLDDIVAPVVAAVLPSIHADLVRRARDLPAAESYERFLLTFGPDAKPPSHEEARAAAASLEALLAANPDIPAPYLPLAYLYNTDFGHTRAGASGPAERARAFDLAKAALAMDRVNAHAYTAVGWAYLRRRQWEPARLHFQQALALNPYHIRRVMEAGYGLIFLGELDMARTLLDRCLLLNPSPRDGFFTDLGLIAMIRGDHDQAASYFELAAEPEIWGSVFRVMNARMTGSDSREGLDVALARIAAIWPPEKPMTGAAIVAWLASHHPFRSDAVGGRFLAAARMAFRDL